jgi:hypothetical protein
MDEVAPLDMVNLAKCQFEAGTPPLFNIVEVRLGAGAAAALGASPARALRGRRAAAASAQRAPGRRVCPAPPCPLCR